MMSHENQEYYFLKELSVWQFPLEKSMFLKLAYLFWEHQISAGSYQLRGPWQKHYCLISITQLVD